MSKIYRTVLLIFIYVIFFLLLNALLQAVQIKLYTTMEPLQSKYCLYYITVYIIIFLEWFFLGIILCILSYTTKIYFEFSTIDFLLSIFFIILFVVCTFKINIILKNGMVEKISVITSIFSGFFFIRGFFCKK